MNNTISNNEKILENYQKRYPNLSDFSYEVDTDSLIYHGNIINLNGYGLSRINEVFFNMEPDDIFTYIKNGFYQDSTKVIDYIEGIVNSEAKKTLVLSTDIDVINTFVHDFYIKLGMWNRNKDILIFNYQMNNKNSNGYDNNAFLSFMSIVRRGMEIINNANNNTSRNMILDEIRNAWNNEININTQTNSNSNTNTLDLGMSRTRTNGSINKYARIFKENEEGLNEPQSYGMAGFTSIVLVVSATLVFGMYLALMLIG